MSASNPKWGLALGGGGARGIAHIGILKALERSGLVPDVITGTSIGALVGGAYACLPDADALEKRCCEVLSPESEENKPLKLIARLNWENGEDSTTLQRWVRSLQKEIFVGLAAFRNGVLSAEELRSCVSAFLPDLDLRETKIPFAPLSVDLRCGRTHLFREGPIVEAVMASCAVPGFMPPVDVDGALLMDGGLADLIPVDAARWCGAALVVAVDVGLRPDTPCRIGDGIDAISRATQIMAHYLGEPGRRNCDLLIEPLQKPVDWTDFTSYHELVRLGVSAGESAVGDIRRLLDQTPQEAKPPVGR